MHNGSLDESLTSITSVSSTNSSLEDLEDDRETSQESRFGMGQKNTSEKKGSKKRSTKNSPSTKKRNTAESAKDSVYDGEFVEVLDSDEGSEGEKKGSDKQGEKMQQTIKYKLGSLLEDSVSDESSDERRHDVESSEDDYDEPEGIDGVTGKYKKKRALQNWRRILFKTNGITNMLEVGEEDDVDRVNDGTNGERDSKAVKNWERIISKVKLRNAMVKKIATDEGSSYGDEEESDVSISNEPKSHAVKNWEKLISKVKIRNAILKNIASDEGSSFGDEEESDVSISNEPKSKAVKNWEKLISKIKVRNAFLKNTAIGEDVEDESANEGNQRAMENWRKVLSKVIDRMDNGTKANLKKLTEKVQSAKENKMGNNTAVENWKRIVEKLLKKNRQTFIVEMINSSKVDYSDSHQSDVDKKDLKRSIENWERMVLKLVEKNKNGSIKKLVKESLKAKALGREGTFSSSDNSDVEKRCRPLKNWERIVARLIKENRITDIGSMILSKTNKNAQIKEGRNDDSESSGGNERPIRNWELIVTKLLKKMRSRTINDSLISKLKEDAVSLNHTDAGHSSIGKHSRSAVSNWERIVSRLQKKSRMRDLQKNILSVADDSASISKEKDETTSEDPEAGARTRQAIKSQRAMKNWAKMTRRLLEGNKESSLRQAINERLKRDNRTALENWERIVSRLIKQMPSSVLLRMVERGDNSRDSNGHQSTSSTENQDRAELNENEKKLRAMKNWRCILLKLKIVNVGNQAKDSNEMEGICPSCKNECLFPILLSCAHTFCRDCITRLIEDSAGELFKCPTCGGKNKLSENDEELFCPNFIVLQQIQHRKSGDTGCRNCGKKKEAQLICAQCADKYCNDCSIKHTRQEAFENHELLDLKTITNADELRKKYYCLKHRKEELTHYCLTCETSVCAKCARKKHSGSKHDCGLTEEAATAGREILKDAATRLEGGTNFDSDLENIDQMQRGLDAELDEMKQEIKNRIQYLIGRLRERETQLYDEVEGRYDVIYDALSKCKDDVNLAAGQTRGFQALIKDLKTHKNEVEMLQMQATVSERMKDIIELKATTSPLVDYDFIFDSNEGDLERVIDNYGSIHVQDRNSKRKIIVDGFEEEIINNENYAPTNETLIEEGRVNKENDRDEYEGSLDTWSPTVRRRKAQHDKKHKDARVQRTTDSDDDYYDGRKERQREPRGKKTKEKRDHLAESPQKQRTRRDSKDNKKDDYQEIKPEVFEFEGFRQPPYDGFTQLISERGEQVKVLEYGVLNYKNESCDVRVKMVCPDRSIVSAHVVENADGAFTVFFCPEVKKDFNCFITVGGKYFKKEYKLLNFYGDFQGMKSKEIDLACRAMSLLRWHITPGLLENKNGKIKRSKKFMKIIGTKKGL